MKNIEQILKSLGIEIPEENKEAFNKEFHENYKTIKEYEGLSNKLEVANSDVNTYKTKYETDIAQRDNDLIDLKAKLEKAGADENMIKQLTGDLETLQGNYDKAKKNYEEQLQKQAYEFAVKEQANRIKFSSNSAKKAFLNDLMETPLQMKDGALLGFNDFVDAYKLQDAGAFVTDEPKNEQDTSATDRKPMFSTKTTKMDDDGGKEQAETKKAPLIW